MSTLFFFFKKRIFIILNCCPVERPTERPHITQYIASLANISLWIMGVIFLVCMYTFKVGVVLCFFVCVCVFYGTHHKRDNSWIRVRVSVSVSVRVMVSVRCDVIMK